MSIADLFTITAKTQKSIQPLFVFVTTWLTSTLPWELGSSRKQKSVAIRTASGTGPITQYDRIIGTVSVFVLHTLIRCTGRNVKL